MHTYILTYIYILPSLSLSLSLCVGAWVAWGLPGFAGSFLDVLVLGIQVYKDPLAVSRFPDGVGFGDEWGKGVTFSNFAGSYAVW